MTATRKDTKMERPNLESLRQMISLNTDNLALVSIGQSLGMSKNDIPEALFSIIQSAVDTFHGRRSRKRFLWDALQNRGIDIDTESAEALCDYMSSALRLFESQRRWQCHLEDHPEKSGGRVARGVSVWATQTTFSRHKLKTAKPPCHNIVGMTTF